MKKLNFYYSKMIRNFNLNSILFFIFILTSSHSYSIPYKGTQILIVGPSHYATDAGFQIAQKGGNFVDVAVTVALTLSVTSPYFASLGGGGFAMIKKDSQVDVLDFRETAPLKTHKNFYDSLPKDASLYGGAAVGVPGIPAGLWELHKKWGKLPWRTLFETPLSLAKNGFRVSGEWVDYTESMKEKLDTGGKKHILKNQAEVLKPGMSLAQPALYKALLQFRNKGSKGFYLGPIAKDIVASIQKSQGVMELEDLSNYKVRWLKPLIGKYKGYTLYLMPPPSSGGFVIQTALELTERIGLEKQPSFSINEYHLLGEILARSFKGRALLGDPDFVKNPIDPLLNKNYLDPLAQTIQLNKSTQNIEPIKIESIKLEPSKLEPSNSKDEPHETTHFVVMDKTGNTISMTITLNGSYGSGIVSDQFGIALNNEMDDFTTRLKEPNTYGLIQGESNAVEPGKRPLSSMSPSIITKGSETVLALGAPGGPRIISAVFQVIYRILNTDLDMDQAIQAPRVHHQYLPHKLFVDQSRFTPETIKGLQDKGHQIEFVKAIAKAYGIKRNLKTKVLEGAYDSRGEGAASGF